VIGSPLNTRLDGNFLEFKISYVINFVTRRNTGCGK